jgi:phage terminase large subunit
MNIKATTNYLAIDDAYREGKRGIVLPGGTRSSKTISAIQWLLLYCMANTGKQIAICRDSLTNLKRTVLKDFESLCYGHNGFEAMHRKLHINKSEMTCKINGNTITFFGLKDDPMRVYGFACDIYFINEAVSTYKATFDQLEQRCREFWICDLNPSEPNSWIYELNRRDDVVEYRSTYLDNPFLPDTIIKKIESYEPNEFNNSQGTSDERKWCIYGKGLVYKGKEIIFPNWTTYKEEPDGYDYQFYGLDWGWNDPMVCIKSTVSGNDLYIREIVYASEIEIEELVVLLKREEPLIKQRTYLVCDSAEPRSINSLQKENIPAMKTTKGAGSIMDGIRKIQGYNIFIHEDSKNMQHEANSYKFKVDDKTETVLDIPVDKNNHGWDAVRYPLITFL